MIFDTQSLFSNQQAITTTAASTNVIDLGETGTPYGNVEALKRDIGKGNQIPLRIQATEAFNASGAGTLTITMETSDAEAFGTGVTTLWTSGAIGKADLVAGKVIIPEYIPRGDYKRYLRLYYTVATGPMTAGKITAGVTMGNQSNG